MTQQRVPFEIIAHILSFLDTPSSLEAGFHDDPAIISQPVGGHAGLPIKSASLVCRRWRKSALRILFRHVVWIIDCPGVLLQADGETAPRIDVLQFLGNNGLDRHVESFTILIEASIRQKAEQKPIEDTNWLWHLIFDQIDPLRFTFIGPADLIASTFNRPFQLVHGKFPDASHILSLSRKTRSNDASWTSPRALSQLPSQNRELRESDANTEKPPVDIFSIRDWTELLLNEGSFDLVYMYRDPYDVEIISLLPIVMDFADPSLSHFRSTIHHLSYIAIRPPLQHIQRAIIRTRLTMKHLYVQTMPRKLSKAAENGRPCQHETQLRLEEEIAYLPFMNQVFTPFRPWDNLQVFESGDPLRPDAWGRLAGFNDEDLGPNGWKMEKEGVFVKLEEQRDESD